MSERGMLKMNLMFDPEMRGEILDLIRSQVRSVLNEEIHKTIQASVEKAMAKIVDEGTFRVMVERAVATKMNSHYNAGGFKEVAEIVYTRFGEDMNKRFDEYMEDPTRSSRFREIIQGAAERISDAVSFGQLRGKLHSIIREELVSMLGRV